MTKKTRLKLGFSIIMGKKWKSGISVMQGIGVFSKSMVQQGLEISGLKEYGPCGYTVFNWVKYFRDMQILSLRLTETRIFTESPYISKI